MISIYIKDLHLRCCRLGLKPFDGVYFHGCKRCVENIHAWKKNYYSNDRDVYFAFLGSKTINSKITYDQPYGSYLCEKCEFKFKCIACNKS